MIPDASPRTQVVPPVLSGRRARPSPRLRSRRALPLDSARSRLDLAGPRVLDEAVFRDLVARERKRADRSEHSFVVLLVERPPTVMGSASEQTVIGALTAVKRKADVVGRFDTRVIGVFLPDVRASEAGRIRERFAARLREELARRSNGEPDGGPSMRVHVHPGPIGAAGDESSGAEPLVFPVRMPRRTIAGAIKRWLDIAGSAALLILLSPLFLLIAALVKLTSRGPGLLTSRRGSGRDLKPFTMLKFRTMHLDADPARHREFVTAFIKAGRAGVRARRQPAFFKMTNDPRVTPVGRLLRKTSLDELPQLWNVLRGDMSLVGPRPPLPYEVEQYKPWHRRRVLEAKPGDHRALAGDRAQPHDVRRDGAPRPPVRQNVLALDRHQDPARDAAAVISGKGAC